MLALQSQVNLQRVAGWPIMIVHGSHLSEHVHIVSNWYSTVTLATECTEKVSFDFLNLG